MNNAFKELFCERAKKDGIKTERERVASYFEQVRSSKHAENILRTLVLKIYQAISIVEDIQIRKPPELCLTELLIRVGLSGSVFTKFSR